MVAGFPALILGLALYLSIAAPSPGAARPRHYRVHAGDTLWSIANSRYAGSDTRSAVYEIRQANSLSDSTIAVGQQLVLP